MFEHQVAIGPEFFRKSMNDYAEPHWAFVREIMQNSMDCGSRVIDVQIQDIDIDDVELTRVIVTNDGRPMDRAEITEKLLALGSSGKDFRDGAVGGFGRAKEILYFAHAKYQIESGCWRVAGSGAGYDLTESPTSIIPGTRSTVWWDGHRAEALRVTFRRFVELAGRQWGGTFRLDGEEHRGGLPLGAFRRELARDEETWARVYTSRAPDHSVVVRVNGIPMYRRVTRYSGCVTVELLGTSAERLTSNRDRLKHPFDDQLDELIDQLSTHRRKALRPSEPAYHRFGGGLLRWTPPEPEPDGPVAVRVAPDTAVNGALHGALVTTCPHREYVHRPEDPAQPATLLGFAFVLKNARRQAVPGWLDPARPRAFSPHAAWLARAWAGVLLELHGLHHITRGFCVGFVLDDEADAQYEEGPGGTRTFLINPAKPGKRGLIRKFRVADRDAIVAMAAHEFVHGGIGEMYHDEDFANRLTEVMAKALRHRRQFLRHF
jgi:hypothetical protein